MTLSNSESAYLIIPVATLKPRFWDNSVFVYIIVVNNNKYLSYVVDNIIFVISVPDYPNKTLKPRFWYNSEICLLFSRKQQQIFIICCWQYHIRNQRTRLPSRTVESNYLRLLWNFCIFCLLYIHINDNKLTYDKFKSAKFWFSKLGMFLSSNIKIAILINNYPFRDPTSFRKSTFLIDRFHSTNHKCSPAYIMNNIRTREITYINTKYTNNSLWEFTAVVLHEIRKYILYHPIFLKSGIRDLIDNR